jgi:rRNA maturation endonuclease Nob1
LFALNGARIEAKLRERSEFPARCDACGELTVPMSGGSCELCGHAQLPDVETDEQKWIVGKQWPILQLLV